jgi:hypothetical protein
MRSQVDVKPERAVQLDQLAINALTLEPVIADVPPHDIAIFLLDEALIGLLGHASACEG